jgi:hypothetical protein
VSTPLAPGQTFIADSFFELRQSYASWFLPAWSESPNAFAKSLLTVAESLGAEPSDISFTQGQQNLGEVSLVLLIRKLKLAVRVNLASVAFVAENPSWDDEQRLIAPCRQISDLINSIVSQSPKEQEANISFHLSGKGLAFFNHSQRFVDRTIVGEGECFGFTRYGKNSSLTIDKSAKYEDAAFVRVQQRFPGSTSITEVTIRMLDLENEALQMLGVDELPQARS